MADERTTITELGTAAGVALGNAHEDLSLLEVVEIPGVSDDGWRSVLSAAADDWPLPPHPESFSGKRSCLSRGGSKGPPVRSCHTTPRRRGCRERVRGQVRAERRVAKRPAHRRSP